MSNMQKKTRQNLAVAFPDPLAEKCLRLEAAGNRFARVMVTIPTAVTPGQPFAATVSLLDQSAMPLIARGETLALALPEGGTETIVFPEGRVAVCRVEGLTRRETGFFRLTVEFEGKAFVSNPSRATEHARPAIFWGDPHIHTTIGDCHAERCRTRNLAYAAARHVYGLDFVAIADHISWAPRGTPGKWYDNLAGCELYDEPGSFSALYCYETSMKGGRGGDCNAYLRQPNRTYVDPWPEDLNAAQLCEQIEGEFFIVPHHTTRTGKHGEIPPEAYPGEKRMPVVEIHSKWGTSEYRGNPTPLKNIHPGPSYAQDLLAHGYRFGFIGGTDSHTSLTFCRNLESEIHRAQPGLTAVIADKNQRDAIFDAVQERRCYAACGERILLDVAFDGLQMGQVGEIPPSGEVSIRAEFAAETDIDKVEIIRNNEVVYQQNPGGWQGELKWTDTHPAEAQPLSDFATGCPTVFYYLRLTAQADARAWSSPCWFNLVAK